MPSYSVWKKQANKLRTTTGTDFERAVLPLLKVIWPALTQVPSKKNWDQKGIDLISWTEQDTVECAVQCKGFEKPEVESADATRTIKSIDAFDHSDVTASCYVVVYNRSGNYPSYTGAIQKRLEQLVTSGKVATAELWDLNTLLRKLEAAISGKIDSALVAYSAQVKIRHEDLFEFKTPYIEEVPVEEKHLVFTRGMPCVVEGAGNESILDMIRLLNTKNKVRWTLVTGVFGTGKTTTVLNFATSGKGNTIIFVACSSLPTDHFRVQSTNMLLEEVLKQIRVFDTYDEPEILYELAGPVFGALLRKPDLSYVLVLDGLDENRAFCSLSGLQTLSNQLVDFRCPIVMTTRFEHLSTMLGDFDIAFEEFSTKSGRKKARLLKLLLWEKDQILSLIEGLNSTEEDGGDGARIRIEQFKGLIQSGNYTSVYGDLPHHPLFLQFILTDVIFHGIRRANRASLVCAWVQRKIRRDLQVSSRIRITENVSSGNLFSDLFLLMENIAHVLSEEVNGNVQLCESASERTILKEAKDVFGNNGRLVLATLLHTLLVPTALPRENGVSVTFPLRMIQEFFIACYCVRNEMKYDKYPDSVQAFCKELKEIGYPNIDYRLAYP